MIDHDAIAARVRCDNTLGLNMCAAYLDLYDEVTRLRAEKDACAIYLKPGETPRERMDRDHKDVLGLMKLLEQKAIRAEEAEAERDRLRAALTIYAQPGNWRFGGCCDPNGPNFTGEAIARQALKGQTND